MTKKLQAIRGMNDLIPEQALRWRRIERKIIDCFLSYGYGEIRFPIVESTTLFKRSIGEVTDIVEKEMYTFDDLNGDSLTLRPEGTAGCVRACLQQGLLHNQIQKLWYYGPMFRHERPQKGRYRQFHQLGVEVYGVNSLAIELELLLLCRKLWQVLGLSDSMQLEINTIGTLEDRVKHRSALMAYFEQYNDKLDEDSKRRLQKNPLRLLDSKQESLQEIIQAAPRLIDYLSTDSRDHFDSLCRSLNELNIEYIVNHRLVRGLDYYCQTVFEWTTQKLGAQGTVCAGGRYDGLVEQLGGRSTPAIGFAIGMERLLLIDELIEKANGSSEPIKIMFVTQGDSAMAEALKQAEEIRAALTDAIVTTNCANVSFKSQFKTADKLGADIALIIGEGEVNDGCVSVKWLKQNHEQVSVVKTELISYLLQQFKRD